jgi:hypothetical protein
MQMTAACVMNTLERENEPHVNYFELLFGNAFNSQQEKSKSAAWKKIPD